MKRFFRHHMVSCIGLGIYCFALLGGTLHHHNHAPTKEAVFGTGSTIQEESSPTSCHEEADSCAICTALHQAKAAPVVLHLTVGLAPTGDAICQVFDTFVFAVPLLQQARGPPTT
jgi:hypothetical protein